MRRLLLVLCAVLAALAQVVVGGPPASATTSVSVTLSASRTSLTVGGAVTFTGTASPFVAGTEVKLHVQVGTWTGKTFVGAVSSSGTFRFTVTPRAGLSEVYAEVAAVPANGLSVGYSSNVDVEVDGFGKVKGDVAWGGNWFAFVEASQLGLHVDKAHLPSLMPAAAAVRQALLDSGVRGVHPQRGGEEVVDHVKLFDELHGERAPGARALTLCPGAAYDRSPCGTGTSAKLAVLHAKGELAAGQWFTSESVLGTRFRGRVASTTSVGPHAAVVPEIEGAAWITGLQQFVIDPDDPCRFGI